MESNSFISEVIVPIFSLVFVFLSFLFLIYFIKTRKIENIKKKRKQILMVISKKLSPILSSNPFIENHFILFSGINGILEDVVLREKLYEKFFNDNSPTSGMIAEQKEKYQLFFEQILKIYAEKLNSVYEREKKEREKYKNQEHNSLSSEEIKNVLTLKKKMEAEKKEAKENFWTLHDALKEIDFEVWGDKKDDFGHKAYLVLKKSYGF